jgi:TolB-like protein
MVRVFHELRRRNVVRVAAAYLAVAWLIVQVVETLFPIFGLSDALMRLIVVLLIIGFPCVLALAWFYELTPEGVMSTGEADAKGYVKHVGFGRHIDFVIIALLAIAVVWLVYDRAVESSIEGNTIAVLPLDNLSPDPRDQYIADGLSDVLTHALSQVDAVSVISRKSAFAVKQQDRDIREVAELLGAELIVEGSVQRLDDRLRVTLQLIDCRSGTNLRSEKYDFLDSDLFAVQDNLSRYVVTAVAQSLSGTVAPATLRPIVSDQALDYHLRGLNNLRRSSRESLELAEQQFKAAIELDSGNIESRYALSDTYNAMMRLGIITYRDGSARKVVNAKEILEQDPESLRALVDIAWLDFAENFPTGTYIAQSYFERALEVPMKHPSTAYEIAYFLRWNDRPDEAIAVLEKALELDPLAQDLLYSAAVLGDSQDAERLKSVYPDSATGYSAAAILHKARGEWADAFDMWSIAAEKDPNNPDYPANQALVLFEVGLVDHAEAALAKARELAPDSTMTGVAEMMSLWVHGDKDRAGELAIAALKEGRHPVEASHFVWFYLARDYALRNDKGSEFLEVANRWMHDAAYKGTRPLDPDFVRMPGVATYVDYWNRLIVIPVLRASGEGELADEMLANAQRFFDNASVKFQKSETDFELNLFAGNHQGAIDSFDRLLDRWTNPEATYIDLNRGDFWSLRLAGVHTLPLHDDPRFQAAKARYDQKLALNRSRIEAQLQ